MTFPFSYFAWPTAPPSLKWVKNEIDGLDTFLMTHMDLASFRIQFMLLFGLAVES